jgi:hypothetical protein
MTSWREEVETAITALLTVAGLAGDEIARADLVIEYSAALHRAPTQLPAGKMAVYGFWSDSGWLKVGRVGPRSKARYTNHHYNLRSARSTLAGSLVKDANMLTVAGFDPKTPGVWIKSATHRVNILMPDSRRPALLSLMEAFLHLSLRPRYEG